MGQIKRRNNWVSFFSTLSGNFELDTNTINKKLAEEIRRYGVSALVSHLHLCGAIPESFESDSTEEKLYSKYTDILICQAYRAMGYTSNILKLRSDSADVECVTDQYSFVADAKAFRLSRSAKNQKDFKIQALDGWKHGKPYAMVVCPVYQLPTRTSQIYHQAATRSVCIMTYTHLAVLVQYTLKAAQHKTQELVQELFKSVEAMNPSKCAMSYWITINRTMLDCDSSITKIWLDEKRRVTESIYLAKQEALKVLAQERERIMKLSREDAIDEVLQSRKLSNRIQKIKAVKENNLLDDR